MAKQGEKMVQQYFEQKYSFEVIKVEETDKKTPDFQVRRNGSLLFYCEEKTLEYVDFEGDIPDSTYNSISRKIHESAKQFNSLNPEHKCPNVLVLNNMDVLKDFHDLVIAVTGKALTEEGKWIEVQKVSAVKKDFETVDLVMWFDKGKFINFMMLNRKYHEELIGIFKM